MKTRLLLFLPLLMVACAPATEWSRADTAPEQRLADEKSCHAVADYQAFDESFGTTAKYPPFRDTQFIQGGGDDGGGGLTVSYSQRGPRLYELTEYCMQQRGYALVRLDKARMP